MRINAVITEQAIIPKGLADILGKLDTGDVIRAKVLEITSGELMLTLFDGTVFRAATASEIDTVPGETLELLVKGKNGGSLILETVKKDATNLDSANNEAIKLLSDLNIRSDTKNVQLAVEIKNAGIIATKEIFEKASLLLDKFTALSPEKAVFLSTKSIPLESRTMDNAIRLIEGNLKLGSQLEDLYSVISKFAEVPKAVKNNYVNQEISQKQMPANLSFTQNNDISYNDISNIDKFYNVESYNDESHNEVTNKLQAKQPENLDNNTVNKGISMKNNAPLNNKGIIDAGSYDLDILKLRQKPIEVNANKTLNNKQGNTAFTKVSPEAKPNEAGLSKIIESDQDILLYRQKNSEENGSEIKELAGKLKESFKGLFVKTASENLSTELDVKKIYKDILDKLDSIKQINQTFNLTERAEITSRVSNIEDGIKLLNQINTNNIYVQIPLNFSGFNTTVDLYIMKKDKSKKRVDPQNAVMLVSLDTQNLGRIETLIDVKGKNVGINLRAEEQKVIDFIRDNYRHLYGSLMDKGYRLVDVKYRILTEGINPANLERSVKKELSVGRISVDLKI